MSNSIFNALGGNKPNLMQMIQQIKSNPAQILSQRFNIPTGINDPNAILQHLVQTGQVPQERLNQAYNIARQMGYKG